MKHLLLFLCVVLSSYLIAQDLSEGYIANDLDPYPQQELDMPGYLEAVADPSFPSTMIRRISEVTGKDRRVPMYNTIQAWNADESLMIIYGNGDHYLLDGTDYTVVRQLEDVNPDDIETIFWHFDNPDILFYLENKTKDFISYNVKSQVKTIIVNLLDVSGCESSISMGNNIQMMSWDSDVFGFRCGNSTGYSYRISTATLTEFLVDDINYTAPMPFPSGDLFYHKGGIYNSQGQLERTLNLDKTGEHSCLGRLANGDDSYYAIAFQEGPDGGCQGTIVAHNATTGECFSVTPTSDYGYPQSGTHISALSHKNSEDGWIAASMMGYDKDGQELLDQELIIAKVDDGSADVYRVGHHRADEDEYDYFGEPHVTISPTGTRLLFGSDWSGEDDGTSLNAYVAELKAYNPSVSTQTHTVPQIKLFPNPTQSAIHISTESTVHEVAIISLSGVELGKRKLILNNKIDLSHLTPGMYFIKLSTDHGIHVEKLVKN